MSVSRDHVHYTIQREVPQGEEELGKGSEEKPDGHIGERLG